MQTSKARGSQKAQKQKHPKGKALGSEEAQALNACMRCVATEKGQELPEKDLYDYAQMYPEKVHREVPTEGGSVFQTESRRELAYLHLAQGTSSEDDTLDQIPYNSLIAETCPRAKLWRTNCSAYEPCPKGNDCSPPLKPFKRPHRYREIVLFHGDQVYPEYLVAYKRSGAERCN